MINSTLLEVHIHASLHAAMASNQMSAANINFPSTNNFTNHHTYTCIHHRIQLAVGDMTMSGWKPTINLIHPPPPTISHVEAVRWCLCLSTSRSLGWPIHGAFVSRGVYTSGWNGSSQSQNDWGEIILVQTACVQLLRSFWPRRCQTSETKVYKPQSRAKISLKSDWRPHCSIRHISHVNLCV